MQQQDDSSIDAIISNSNDGTSTTLTTLNDGRKVIPQRVFRLNRAKSTILHFLVTYPIFSYKLYLLLAMAICPLQPFETAVRLPFRSLDLVVSQESARHVECIHDGFRAVQTRMNATLARESEKVTLAQEGNRHVVERAMQIAEHALQASHTARRTLQALQVVPWETNRTTCSEDDLEQLQAGLPPQTVYARHALRSSWDDYLEQSRNTLQHLATYSQDRAAYDYHYFIGIKVEGTLGALDALQAPNVTLALPDLTVQLEFIVKDWMDALTLAQARLALLQLRLGEFHTSIGNFHVSYGELFERLELASHWWQDFLPTGDVPWFLDLQGLPTADVLLPPVMDMPVFDVPLPNVDVLLDDYIRRVMELLAQVLQDLVEEASEQTRQAIELVVEQLRELLTLEDYHPPVYEPLQGDSLVEEHEQLEETGESTKKQTLDIMDRLQEGKREAPEVEAPILLPIDSDLGETPQATEFTYRIPHLPRLRIPQFLRWIFDFLTTQWWLMEFIIQFIRLDRLRRKYQRNATPVLPKLAWYGFQTEKKESSCLLLWGGGDDEEEDNDEDVGQKPKSPFSIVKEILVDYVLTAWTAAALVAMIAGLVVVCVWYPNFYEACIATNSGTALGKGFVAPIYINSASTVGNAVYASSALACHGHRQEQCRMHHVQAENIFQVDESRLQTARLQIEESLRVTQLMDQCVEVDEVDQDMNTDCCGLVGYVDSLPCSSEQNETQCPIDLEFVPPSAFSPLGSKLTEVTTGTYDMEAWILDEAAHFSCDDLTCEELACDGVDADLIEAVAIEATCRAEFYIIKVLHSLITVTMCACFMIMGCRSLLNGVQILTFRSLSVERLYYTTFVLPDGALDEIESQDFRQKRVTETLYYFRMEGIMKVVFSGLVLTTGAILFVILRFQLDYLRTVYM